MKLKLICTSLLIIMQPAAAASFDCSKVNTHVEKLICANPLLGRLDEAMNKNYRGALETDIGTEARRDLDKTQWRWLKERNRCKAVTCLEASYRARIDALCDYPAVSGVNWGCTATSQDVQ